MMAVQRDKGLFLLYSKPGVGKTLAAHHAAKSLGLNSFTLLFEADGLSSVEVNLGYTPEHYLIQDTLNPLPEMLAVIEEIVKPGVASGQYSAIIIDTISVMGTLILDFVRQFGGDGKEMKDARHLYPEVARQIMRLVFPLTRLPVWLIALAHTREPATNEGRFRQGGPDLPGSAMKDVCAQFSAILQMTVDKQGGKREMLCDEGSPAYFMKDRYRCAKVREPADFRKNILRAAFPGQPLPELEPLVLSEIVD